MRGYPYDMPRRRPRKLKKVYYCISQKDKNIIEKITKLLHKLFFIK